MILVWTAKTSGALGFMAAGELFANGNCIQAFAALPLIAGSVYSAHRFARWRAQRSAKA